jgi:hypothetical protein
MPLFNKNKKNENSKAKNNKNIESYENPKNTKNKKDKKGFRARKKQKQIKSTDTAVQDIPEEINTIKEENLDEKKAFSTKKKKAIIKKDMKGKPVYLEDTGEKLGIVYDTIYDTDKNVVGFKIKDKKSEAILSFPSDQFDESSKGLIFVPGWYTNSIKIIEKLEFKDKISPELTALLTDDAVSNEELYDIFVKHDDDMAQYIEDAKSTKEMLLQRLKVLEKQRLAMKENLMDLTEKRLIKDIDRREFSEDVMEHRRKVNILDLNIKKCKELLNRIENTSFGVLGDNNMSLDKTDEKQKRNFIKNYENPYNKELKDLVKPMKMQIPTEPQDSYKEKYFKLKTQFDQLEDNYQELKTAVDKLFKQD